VLLVWQLAMPRPYLTGTNSVGVRSIVADVNVGQRLCVPALDLPAGTGRVQLGLFGQAARSEAAISVVTARRVVVSRTTWTPRPPAPVFVQASIPPTPSSPATVPATVCVAPLKTPLAVGGMIGLQANQVPAQLESGRLGSGARPAGVPVTNRVAVAFLPPSGAERSLLASLGDIFARAALFRPGVVGAWTYPVLLFLILPLAFAASLFLLARSAAQRPVMLFKRKLRPGVAIVLIAFVNAGAWALITPAFNAPDEPDHFAYAQYLATTGHAPPHSNNTRPAFSTDHTLALEAVNIYSVVSLPETRPPWLASQERAWERLRARTPHPSDNGGGTTPAASPHQPAYYLLLVPAYAVVASQSPFSQLTAMRLTSALLGALVALCAFGIVRELLPRQPVAAVAAGLLVAFQPMFGFMSGAVNNDSGVNAAAAVCLYLLIRALRRAPTWQLGVGLGAAAAITPLMKETGFEIYPAIAVGLLGIGWRNRRGAELRRAGIYFGSCVGAFVGVRLGWALLQPVFYPPIGGHSTAAGGVATTSALSLAEQYPTRFLVYLWELFLPRLPFMGQHFPPGWPFKAVYIIRGWGAFGWYVWEFPNWVYDVIILTMGAVGLLALFRAVRSHRVIRAYGFEVAVILLVVVGTVVAVEAAFFDPVNDRAVVAEQGRYVFPAITALAAIAVAGTFGLGRRWQMSLATALVVAMMGLSYAAQWLTLGSAFT
jgi:4-amino-4-deoxy-L-arabinose transferase-like glycosyltransferase